METQALNTSAYQILFAANGKFWLRDLITPFAAAIPVIAPSGVSGRIVSIGSPPVVHEVAPRGLYQLSWGEVPSRTAVGSAFAQQITVDGVAAIGTIIYVRGGLTLYTVDSASGTITRLGNLTGSTSGISGPVNIGGSLYVVKSGTPGSLWRITLPSLQFSLIDADLGDVVEPVNGGSLQADGWHYGLGAHGLGRWKLVGRQLTQEISASPIDGNIREPRSVADVPADLHRVVSTQLAYHGATIQISPRIVSARSRLISVDGVSSTSLTLRQIIGVM